jgi:hypothetical protein
VLSDALKEFADAVKIARDDLDQAIADIVPNRFFEAEFDGAGYEAGDRVIYVDKDIKRAFIDFDWLVERALRELKRRLTAPALETQGATS